MNNRDRYERIFMELFNVDKHQLNEKFNFSDVETWDSLTHLTVISELEDAFEVMFETDDILNFGGFLNGIKILQKYHIDIK